MPRRGGTYNNVFRSKEIKRCAFCAQYAKPGTLLKYAPRMGYVHAKCPQRPVTISRQLPM